MCDLDNRSGSAGALLRAVRYHSKRLSIKCFLRHFASRCEYLYQNGLGFSINILE